MARQPRPRTCFLNEPSEPACGGKTTDEGYLLKAESAAMVLEPLGLVVYDPASGC